MAQNIYPVEFVKASLSFLPYHIDELARNKRLPGASMHIVHNYLGEVGKTVGRVHFTKVFPHVMQNFIDDTHIQEALKEIPNVEYDKSSMWFTITASNDLD